MQCRPTQTVMMTHCRSDGRHDRPCYEFYSKSGFVHKSLITVEKHTFNSDGGWESTVFPVDLKLVGISEFTKTLSSGSLPPPVGLHLTTVYNLKIRALEISTLDGCTGGMMVFLRSMQPQ